MGQIQLPFPAARYQAATKAEHSDIISPGYHSACQDKTNSITDN